MKLKFKVEKPYSLDLTMKPSFLSSLYSRIGSNEWIKIAGSLAGKLKLKFNGKYLIAVCTADLSKSFLERQVYFESGLWHEPFEFEIHKLPSWIKPSIEFLSNKFSGVRIAISPLDFNCIFIAVVLSKRARYEVFVRNWVRQIWFSYGCSLNLISKLSLRELEVIGRSYQLKHLIDTVKDYIKVFDSVDPLSFPVPILRRKLMKCWGIGPKTADAIILFTTTNTNVLPIDTHFIKAVKEFNWISNFKLPIKNLCLKYSCNREEMKLLNLNLCPLSIEGSCIREFLRSIFDDLSGWIQTLTYLYGQSKFH